MIQRATIDKLIPILRADVRRALRMRVAGFPRPYYVSFLLRDINWFNTWASSGSTYRRRSDHTRNVYCDVRVGSYRYDQTTDGGLLDNDEELESVNHVTMPIDDRCHDGLRLALWRLSESKFREALSDYNHKEAARLSTVDANRKYCSFVKEKPVHSIQYSRPEKIDEEYWTMFCKKASIWLSELNQVSGNWVEFDAAQQTKIFVNTEGSVIVQQVQIYTLNAVIRNLTREGAHIEQEVTFNCATQRELPDMRSFKKLASRKHQQLQLLVKAKRIHSFSGPVLLCPRPAGLLFHEAIGHRLEGSRLLSAGEGQTFKGQVGKKILNVALSIRDDPSLKRFKGQRCIGAFDYDDEGVRAQSANLVERGLLSGFLGTRAALKSGAYRSNGHARNKKFQRPISRMGVTIVQGDDPVSMAELREMLVQEIKDQRKPFGMIVYEATGGETDTTSYNFQAFSGDISYATLVFPDGSEQVVKGVNFVGTPLQALNNIIAVGDQLALDNSFCGAESGFIPVSTIAPAILLSDLELQARDEELVTQYILPRPRITKLR